MEDSSENAKSARNYAASKLGGSSSMGNFRITLDEELRKSLPRSYSASMDGTSTTMTPSEMGRQEMYTQVPFVAIPGLQKKEREVANIFASYAADLDVASTRGLSDMEKSIRHASSSMLILEEMEDAKVVTAPLIFTVIIVSASMFSVGHNTSVMNAPEKVVFPGHSITSWALAVAAFAIGGPFGSGMGGKLADQRGRRGAMLIGIWIFLLGGLMQTGTKLTNRIRTSRSFAVSFEMNYSANELLSFCVHNSLSPNSCPGYVDNYFVSFCYWICFGLHDSPGAYLFG